MRCEVPAYKPYFLNKIQLKMFLKLCFTMNLKNGDKVPPSTFYKLLYSFLRAVITLYQKLCGLK